MDDSDDEAAVHDAPGGEAPDETPDEASRRVDRELAARELGWAEPLVAPLWRAVRTYFRAEVRGLERIPPDRPVIFVGNHSGGFGSIDSAVFLLGFFDHAGEVPPLYWMAHELVMKVPILGDFLRSAGAITGSREGAKAAIARGASVVVYPGGEVELYRPWTARNEIRFHGRKGFLRIAQETGAPIVPIVAHGGHNTIVSLTDGEAIARALRLDRLLRLKALPVYLAAPWGLTVGGFLPHIPLPARITVEVLPAVDIAGTFDRDLDAAYAHVTGVMQEALDGLAAEFGP